MDGSKDPSKTGLRPLLWVWRSKPLSVVSKIDRISVSVLVSVWFVGLPSKLPEEVVERFPVRAVLARVERAGEGEDVLEPFFLSLDDFLEFLEGEADVALGIILDANSVLGDGDARAEIYGGLFCSGIKRIIPGLIT